MPALPDVPGVLRYDLFYQVGSDLQARSRLFFSYTGGPPSNGDCTTLATTAAVDAGINLAVYMNVEDDILGAEVTDLTTPTSGRGSHFATVAGSVADPPLAASACVLVNYTIGRRYRGGKPRTYFRLGAASDLQTPQTWKSTSTTNWLAAINAWINNIKASSAGTTAISQHVSVSYYSGFTAVTNPITGRTRDVPKVRSVAIAPDVVLSNAINPKVASQRRRDLHSV